LQGLGQQDRKQKSIDMVGKDKADHALDRGQVLALAAYFLLQQPVVMGVGHWGPGTPGGIKDYPLPRPNLQVLQDLAGPMPGVGYRPGKLRAAKHLFDPGNVPI
jgi:hypothetical protein